MYVRTEGVTGNGFSREVEKGRVGVRFDNGSIYIDDYEGFGDTYHAVDDTKIQIYDKGNDLIFLGTLQELRDKLK